MPKTLQFKRYPHSAVANTTGANGELIIDTTSYALTVHDGVTAGGHRLATESYVLANGGGGVTSNTDSFARNTANLAFSKANAAFDKANTSSNYGNSNVASYLPSYGGVVNASSLTTETLYSNTFLNAVSAGAVQFQYDPSGVYNFYSIANGNWFYLNNEGLVFQSNTNGLFDYDNYYAHNTIALQNDGSIYATGNITAPNIFSANLFFSANNTILYDGYSLGIQSNTGVEMRRVDGANATYIGVEPSDAYMVAEDGTNRMVVDVISTSATIQNFDGSTYRTWSFDQTGTLTFPDNSTYQTGTLNTHGITYTVDTVDAPILIKGGAEIDIFLNYGTANQSGVEIYNDGLILYSNEPTQSGWQFTNQSKIRFPDYTYQSTAFTGYGTDNVARTTANTASGTATASFTKANTASNTAALAFTQANNAYNQSNTAVTYTQSTGSYANSAFIQANNAVGVNETQNNNIQLVWNQANNNIGIDATQNTNITTASNLAQSAYTAANNASSTIAQNPQSASYILALTDAGKHIYSTNTTTQVITLPNNGTVSWPVGSTIMLVVQGSGKMNVVPATGITMYMANNSTAKTYANVYSYGMATLLNVASNTWFINGAGVS